MAQVKTFVMKDDGVTPLTVGAGTFYVNVVDTALNDSDKEITVDEDFAWQLISVYASLASTATAGNRQIEITIDDAAGNVLGWFKAAATQAASLTEEYHFGVSGDTLETVAGTHFLPLAPVVLAPNWNIRIFDSAAVDAAADDLVIRVLALEFRKP